MRADTPNRKGSGDCILIAAGGTGGHLIPALEIAFALQALEPAVHIEFIGSGRPLESQTIDAAGYQRHQISTSGIKRRGLAGLARFCVTFPIALGQVWRIFRERKPKLVIGVGGYVTFIPVTLARLCGIPAWIHEAELKPGLANWVLSLYASRVSLAFEGAKMPGWARTVVTGHPLRSEIRAAAVERKTVTRPRKLLVVGGSQGARAIDAAMEALAGFIKAEGLEVWHQCRPESVEGLRAAYSKRQVTARVDAFISDMAAAYRYADIVLARAGAGTVMEIGAVNIPAVFVPYPFAQGGHQLANAEYLARAGKAVVVEEGEHFEERLKEAIAGLTNAEGYAAMLARPSPARSLDAAERIAQGCLGMMG